MVRDGVANIVYELHRRGLDPHRVGPDSWEARCPAHGGVGHALAISRNDVNHVLLECRSAANCQYARIIAALGFTNDHVYAETPDWLIGRMSRVPIQATSFARADGNGNDEIAASNSDRVSDAAGTNVAVIEPENGPVTVESSLESRLQAVPELKIPPEGGTPTGVPEAGTLARSEEPDPGHPSTGLAFPYPALSPCVQSPEGSLELRVVSPATTEVTSENLEGRSIVRILSRLAASAELFRSADGRFCAQIPVGDRREIFGLRSAGFRDWLIDGYLSVQSEPPSSWAIRRVVGMLEARARFSTGIPEVFVRVGQGEDSSYFLDLGDSIGHAASIGDQGWHIVERPGVYFRRPEGLLPLPMPTHWGSIDLLRPYVNLAEPDFRLMIAWLTAALRPVGPYPILVLNGEQSSGKSTLARILRLLIDPQACPVLALPRSPHDLMATAVNGWLLVYENISTIADSLSDCICQLAFGGGFASRTLFTNDERSIIYAQRPVILVGIDDFVLRGDLRDRSVFLHLPPIPVTARRTERTFWPAFRADYPQILGAVLDAIVGGLRELPSVDLNELPRMADFAEWGEATSRGLGWGAGTFISAYNANRKEATELLLDDSPVATAMLTIARNGINWSGTPLKLFKAVSKIASKKGGARWPKTVGTFGNELRRIAPHLRLHGLSITFERKRDARVITLKSEQSTARRS